MRLHHQGFAGIFRTKNLTHANWPTQYFLMPQETTFSLGCWSRVKRFLASSKIVKPAKEVQRQMSQLTVLQAICIPLAIAAADIATDTGFLFNMWSYILNPEVTDASGLIGVQMASIFILVLSVINMVVGNPAKTLIRNAHRAVLMELEKRDVRPSVGNNSGTMFNYL